MVDEISREDEDSQDELNDGEFENMDEEEFEAFLADAITEFAEENDAARTRIRTFADAALLTGNKGLVVRIGEAEFQLTVVRSC